MTKNKLQKNELFGLMVTGVQKFIMEQVTLASGWHGSRNGNLGDLIVNHSHTAEKEHWK